MRVNEEYYQPQQLASPGTQEIEQELSYWGRWCTTLPNADARPDQQLTQRNLSPCQQQLTLPSELWQKIFEYLTPRDAFQLSLVCTDFAHLAQDEQLWVTYCRKASRLSRKEVESFSCCPRELYRLIIKPFRFALGYKVMWPGFNNRPGQIAIRGGQLVIESPQLQEGGVQTLLTATVQKGKVVIDNLVTQESLEVMELQKFMKENIVIFFLERYMRIDGKMLCH